MLGLLHLLKLSGGPTNMCVCHSPHSSCLPSSIMRTSAGLGDLRGSARATGLGLPALPTRCPSSRHGEPLQPSGRTSGLGGDPEGQGQPPARAPGGLAGHVRSAAGAVLRQAPPGEAGGGPRGGPGLAARGLCAGQAALPHLPAGGAGLWCHAGRPLVHLAVFLRGCGPAGQGHEDPGEDGVGGLQGPGEPAPFPRRLRTRTAAPKASSPQPPQGLHSSQSTCAQDLHLLPAPR